MEIIITIITAISLLIALGLICSTVIYSLVVKYIAKAIEHTEEEDDF